MNILLRVCSVWVLLAGMSVPAYAQELVVGVDPSPSVYIQAVRVKGEEFIALKNRSDNPINLAAYKLQYFNDVDAIAAMSSKIIDISAAIVPAGGTVFLITEPLYACETSIVHGITLGFADKKGLVQLVEQYQLHPGAPIEQQTVDSFAWSDGNITAEGVKPVLQDAEHFYWRDTEQNIEHAETDPITDTPPDAQYDEWSWVHAALADDNVCEVVYIVPEPDETVPEQPAPQPIAAPLTTAPTNEPPATIKPPVVLASSSSSTSASTKKPVYPARSIGLAAPQITELLPNPGSPKTDADDEFFELYNSNDKVFELSGFAVEVGTKSTRKYTFPQGTLLEPKSFTAFFSTDTNISLSNTESQARLLDPYGNVIAQTDVYSKAKDDQAWVLAAGKWYWSTTTTPGAANIVTEPAVKAAATTASARKKLASASAANGSGAGTTQTSGSVAADPLEEPNQNDQLHPLVLAAFASLTIGYAVYEYRQDITNRIEQFKRDRAYRRANRSASSGR